MIWEALGSNVPEGTGNQTCHCLSRHAIALSV